MSSAPAPAAPDGGAQSPSAKDPPPPAAPADAGPTVPFLSLFRFADAQDRLSLLLILLCAAFSGVAIPLTSLVLGQLLNGSIDTSSADYAARVDTAALHMTLLAIGCFLSLGGGVLLSYHSSSRQALRLRRAYLRALLRQDAAYADAHPLPLAAARVTEDTLSVQAGTGEKLFLVLAGFAQFVGSFALAFSVAADAWRLGLTLLVLVPFAIAAVGLLFSFVSGLSGASDDAYASAGAVLVEALSMVRTVAALGGEEHEAARYNAHLATAEKAGLGKGLASGAGQGIFSFVMCALYGVGLYAGARFIAVSRGEHPECGLASGDYQCFTGGAVIQVLFAVVGGVFALGIVAPNLGYLAGARSAGARLHALIDHVPGIDALGPDEGEGEGAGEGEGEAGGLAAAASAQAGDPSLANARIVFEGVSFAYPSRPHEPVLRRVSFVVEPGTCLALVGPSGAGKSSIVALLERYYDPTEGRITINGVDLRALRVPWLRRHLALVSQEPQLLPVSVRDNIAAGAGAGEVEAAAAAADIHDFVAALPQGYDTIVSSSRLSGGQKQRVCIARALARAATAPVLLFDEATSALDSASEARISSMLTGRRGGAAAPTMVMVAHRLSTVAAAAHTVVVLQAGEVAETGTHAELVAKEGGVYARLWALGGGAGAGAGGAPSPPPAPFSPLPPIPPSPKAQPPLPAPPLHPDHLVLAAPAGGAGEGGSDDGKGAAAAAEAEARDWALVPRTPWLRAWALQAPEAGWVCAGVALTLLSGALLPAFAVLLTRFVVIFYDPDAGAMQGTALVYMGAFFGMALGMVAVNTAQGYAFAAFGEPFLRRLRSGAFSSVLAQGVAFLDSPRRSPTLLAARLGSEATKLRLALGARLGEKLSSLSTLFVGVGVAFSASWQLTLLVLALGPAVVLAADAENTVTYGAEAEAAKAELTAAAGLAGEAVAAVRVVHAFGLEARVLERFAALLRAQNATAAARARALGLGYGASQAAQVLSMAIVFKAGLALAAAGQPGGNPEAVFLVFFSFQFACFALPNLTSLRADAAAISDSLRAFFSILSTAPEVDAGGAAAVAWAGAAGSAAAAGAAVGDAGAASAARAATPTPAALVAVPRGRIELRDVHFSYPSRPGAVLRGCSLVIEAGQTAALVGPSGCGKSSVIALLLRLYEVQAGSGSVSIDGVDVRGIPPRALREAMGWVQQEAPLFDESIAYNIAYGRAGGGKAAPAPASAPAPAPAAGEAPAQPAQPAEAPPADVAAAAAAAQAAGFIGALGGGYGTRVGVGGGALSGGQKQRIALARALVRAPRVLLLDEATAALDNASEREVQESIDRVLEGRRAGGGGGTTAVIVAHRLSTIARCDVIFAMREGRVEEAGTYAELLARRGLFFSLAQAQGLC